MFVNRLTLVAPEVWGKLALRVFGDLFPRRVLVLPLAWRGTHSIVLAITAIGEMVDYE